ncbi:MAG: glutamate synthase-related protein [Akkermansiaceae bacterium]
MAASIDLHKISKFANLAIPAMAILFFFGGYFVSFYFHFLTVIFLLLTVVNLFYLCIQKKHTILRNFGILGQARYIIESIGPEMRQYLFANDTEERPFNRIERSEIYRKAKGIDSASSFGSQLEFDNSEVKIRHSMYPVDKKDIKPYSLTFGEERGLTNTYTITKPYLISAMSFGALGQNAVQALARGARLAGIGMNTGEGGTPKYHMAEGGDLIFQMGTAKFGVRNLDGSLSDDKLRELCAQPTIKMVEIKLSQGAKPGKGGLLPKEKITQEISELRGVSRDHDVVSPAHHIECTDKKSTIAFIKHVQDICNIPVGIKLCIGKTSEFLEMVIEMKKQNVFPDFIAIDGAEGGTGAAPKAFMDGYGMPLMPALYSANKILVREGVRDRLKIIASGKLINSSKQFIALALGADAIYTARGFMLSLGCIQAMLCGNNTCPVGITTHDPTLQKGLIVEEKAKRVANYVHALEHDFYEMLAASGIRDAKDISIDQLYIPSDTALADQINALLHNPNI